jgi:hypothetical protein
LSSTSFVITATLARVPDPAPFRPEDIGTRTADSLCGRSLVRFVDGDTEYNRPRMAVLHEFVDRDDVAAAALHEILTRQAGGTC